MTTFLGQPCENGVDPSMVAALAAVEENLRELHRAAGVESPFEQWAGIHEPHKGIYPGGHHAAGIAVDLNYTTNPYVATRTVHTFGGERGSAVAVRRAAVEVYDRAVAFTFSETDTSDTSCRIHDSIGDIYDHFQVASDCLVYYLGAAFSADPRRVDRRPVPGVAELADGDPAFDVFGAELPGGLAAADAVIAALDGQMSSDGWREAHPNWPYTPAQQYWQLLRDFELVRTPMVFGSPADVRSTRNPARGFLDLRREVVLALVEVGGMRWGACDFGPDESGDIMHFDLGW
ncbi:hypothetical protein [Actinophytocola sp.]|uniref:hypothetical protein n=1 Tax=Actinophytocola sp. TaxID=1872138 RepID=UPI002D80BDD4|nr:hypothetical protein [Actinophytocola sp.]HET9143112.1 hypothetical protein [Actinophytocola sp.]